MLLVRQTQRVFSFRHAPTSRQLPAESGLPERSSSLKSPWEKRLKIGAKVVHHGCYVISFGTRRATETLGCSPTPSSAIVYAVLEFIWGTSAKMAAAFGKAE